METQANQEKEKSQQPKKVYPRFICLHALTSEELTNSLEQLDDFYTPLWNTFKVNFNARSLETRFVVLLRKREAGRND